MFKFLNCLEIIVASCHILERPNLQSYYHAHLLLLQGNWTFSQLLLCHAHLSNGPSCSWPVQGFGHNLSLILGIRVT